MALPLGHRIDGEFVCMKCITDADHREGGVGSGYSAVDQRVGSGKDCSRCDRKMPYLAHVEVVPDGFSVARRDDGGTLDMRRSTEVMVDRIAHVRLTMGCQREIAVFATPEGGVEVLIWDDPYDEGPANARFIHSPAEQSGGGG